MSSKGKKRRVVAFVAAIALFAGGGVMAWNGLHAPPENTPAPTADIVVSPEEAVELASSGLVATPDIPQGDFGPHVRTTPVEEPPPVTVQSNTGTGGQGGGSGESGQSGSGGSGGGGGDERAVKAGFANRIQIPGIYVDSRIVTRGIDSAGRMDLSSKLSDVIRLNTTAELRSDEGSTLVAGHVTQNRVHGALYFLGKLTAGSQVRTWDADGNRVDWVVTSVRMYNKQALPADIYDPSGKRQLVLVTCGGNIFQLPSGRWTHESNIVVTAVPASSTAQAAG